MFLTALKKKYQHLHREFAETGDIPLVCCCKDTVCDTDVANLEDLLSEIDFTSLQVEENVPKTPNSVWEPPLRDLRLICGICNQMVRELRSLVCGHYFCRVCITTVHRLTKNCPVCGLNSNAIIGTMPPGTMTHIIDAQELPGFQGYDTIIITYRVEDGVQSDEHPNPNKWYRGISCTAFLPNTLEGQIVLMLLQTAWQRRLTFTLKQSVSSTPHCVLTWNKISHKTNRTGGPECNGYPDSGYLRRVKKELYHHGIVEEDLRSTMV